MESLLKGRLRNTHLPHSNAMIPLFEAIVNSIHSIEDHADWSGRPLALYRISVEVIRLPQASLLPETKNGQREQIVAFEIEDNGIGFTETNWKSFGVLDSFEKASRGCRGIGRLTWLKAFAQVRVSSVYFERGKYLSRKFSFDPNNSIHKVLLSEVDAQINCTKILLDGFSRRYAESAPKTARALAISVLEHCLWYFVREVGVPKIFVVDGEDLIDLDDLFDEHMHASAMAEPINVKGERFELTHVKFRAAINKNHVANYCAAGRVVRTEGLRERIPGLNGILIDGGGQFTYAAYLVGDYFNDRVSGQRVDFNIDETSGGLFSDEISFDDIRAEMIPCVRSYLLESLEANILASQERIERFVSLKAPRYRPILKYVPDSELIIDANISDVNLDAMLHKQLFRVEQGIIAEGHKIMVPGDKETEEKYMSRLDGYLQKVSDIKR